MRTHVSGLQRSTVIVAAVPLLVVIGCGSQNPPTGPSAGAASTPPASAPTTGQLAFSSTASKGWTSISVAVDGQAVGTPTAYVSNTMGSCSASARRVVVR